MMQGRNKVDKSDFDKLAESLVGYKVHKEFFEYIQKFRNYMTEPIKESGYRYKKQIKCTVEAPNVARGFGYPYHTKQNITYYANNNSSSINIENISNTKIKNIINKTKWNLSSIVNVLSKEQDGFTIQNIDDAKIFLIASTECIVDNVARSREQDKITNVNFELKDKNLEINDGEYQKLKKIDQITKS